MSRTHCVICTLQDRSCSLQAGCCKGEHPNFAGEPILVLLEDGLRPSSNKTGMHSVNKPVPGALGVQTLTWIETRSVANPQQVAEILESEEKIDLGEAEAIVLTLELNADLLNADLLLMDERRGRMLATNYRLNVTGLLGVLLQAKRKGLIAAVQPVLNQLIEQAGFRVSQQLYATVLQSAGE